MLHSVLHAAMDTLPTKAKTSRFSVVKQYSPLCDVGDVGGGGGAEAPEAPEASEARDARGARSWRRCSCVIGLAPVQLLGIDGFLGFIDPGLMAMWNSKYVPSGVR